MAAPRSERTHRSEELGADYIIPQALTSGWAPLWRGFAGAARPQRCQKSDI